MTETVFIVALIVLDVGLLLALAAWAARGGAARALVGLAASALFGVLVGVPIFAVATLMFRRRVNGLPPAGGPN
jgi:hypothetical protein